MYVSIAADYSLVLLVSCVDVIPTWSITYQHAANVKTVTEVFYLIFIFGA